MKKPPPPIPTRHVLWLGWKIVFLLSVSLCAFGFFRLHHQPRPSPLAVPRHRSLSFSRSFTGAPKLAFLFLARRNLPLDFLWSSFFEVRSIFSTSSKIVIFQCFSLRKLKQEFCRVLMLPISRYTYTLSRGLCLTSLLQGRISSTIGSSKIAFRWFNHEN